MPTPVRVFRKTLANGKPSPTFYFRVSAAGKIVQMSTGCRDRRAAERFARDHIEKLRECDTAREVTEKFRDVLSGGKDIALSEAWSRFLEKPKRRDLSPVVATQKQAHWDDFVAFLADRFPNTQTLRAVTREQADAYIKHLQVAGKFDRGIHFQPAGRHKEIVYHRSVGRISAKTVNDYLGDIKQVFTALAPDSGLVANPFAHLSKQRAQPCEREAFTADELRLIGQRADPFLYPLFAIGISTGLRAGDICTLRWAEVDLTDGWINREMRKTKRVIRVPLLPGLRQYLAALPRAGEFVSPELAAMYEQNPTGITYRVKRFLETLQIRSTKQVPGRSRMASTKDIHSLRHTFVYVAAASGIPLPVVQSIVGHLTPRMTQHYANHANDQLKAATIQRLPDYLGLPSSVPLPPTGPALTSEEKMARIASLVTNEHSPLAAQIQAILRS